MGDRRPRVHLPILDTEPGPARASTRRWRFARWRAVTLILVYVLMTAHVVHWALTGRSVSRFVLSDSMRTLELGEINPGFLLFVASLLVTVIFGRFMCGWVCHMGALQDLAAWILRKAGIRPRLFRSRFLGYVPLAIALYMFVWPSFNRVVAAPLMGGKGASLTQVLAAATQFPGLSEDFTSERLWEGLPSVGVAIPFLLICGFATVYFLGARGLCRYGCPYGGFLLPAERLALGRVVVDWARCDQCGLCTSACTTGVRVHDEVRHFASVRDRNCIRSLDCIASCPSSALSYSFFRPPSAPDGSGRDEARAARDRYDLSLLEEIACIGVFAGVFFVGRDLYGLVPMLLAATVGTLIAFLTWKTIRLFRDANVRCAGLQLRRRGRLGALGVTFLAVMSLLLLLAIQSASVRLLAHQASRFDDLVTVGYQNAIARNNVSPSDLANAGLARDLYTRSGWVGAGGIALAATPDWEFRLAWMNVVLGDFAEAERVLRDLVKSGRTSDSATRELARLYLNQGRMDDAISALEQTVNMDSRAESSRDLLANVYMRRGRGTEAEALYARVLALRPGDSWARCGLGRVTFVAGRTEEGLADLSQAARESPGNVDIRREYALALFSNGKFDAAIAELMSAADARPARRKELDGLMQELSRRMHELPMPLQHRGP